MKNRHRITFLIPQNAAIQPPKSAFILRVHRAGIVWHELAPIMLRAQSKIAKRLVSLMLASSAISLSRLKAAAAAATTSRNEEQQSPSIVGDTNNEDIFSGYRYRQCVVSRKLLPLDLTIAVVPPTKVPSPDFAFLSVVLQTEHQMLQLQSLSAWLSTLGGGYFFCKRLSVSLALARQQRALAVRLGNVAMIRQCTINEAYNLIYSGKFAQAKRVLRLLEKSCIEAHDDDTVTLRQCHAARLFAKRVKDVTQKGILQPYRPEDKNENHMVDDFQRIRIVEE